MSQVFIGLKNDLIMVIIRSFFL